MAEDFVATDAQLVERARLGDSAAFETLVRRYARPVYAVALSMVGDHQDAEDVCQDVFVRVIERLEECRTPARFAGWLFAIARSTAQNARRRERRRRSDALESTDAASGDNPARDAERSELRARIGVALAKLSRAECDVVLLHDLEGWGHRAVGEALGISEVHSRQHLFVARQKLRAQLADLHQMKQGDDD
jgi:RNA polymerase sigma-70 factor, ECF subfamily